MMEGFEELMSDITIKRQTKIPNGYDVATIEHNSFIIQGIIQAPSIYKRGSDFETKTTTDKGRFGIGELLLITFEELKTIKDGLEDIVVGDDGDYRIISKKKYDKLIEHFEYICTRII